VDDVAYQQFERLDREHWWLRGRRSIFFSLLDHLLPRERTMSSLDVGCGYGGMLRELERYGPAHGVDIFPEAVDYCRRHGIERVRLASAYALPAPDESFDILTFFDCIEHLDDDLAALRESHRVLRAGGHLVVTVPAYNFLYANNDRVAHHKRRYTVRELRSKLEAADFELRKATYVNTLLFPVILPLVLLKKLKERFLPVTDDPRTNLTHPVPKLLNEALFRIFRSEQFVLRRMSFPVGHSIFVLAEKSSQAPVTRPPRVHREAQPPASM
jgi:SAM-dependent methyltransferase